MLDPENEGESHHGKAMMAADENGVTATIECNQCGRQVYGPIPFSHLRATISMLEQIADELGLPKDWGVKNTTKVVRASNHEEAAAVRRAFEKMPMDKGALPSQRKESVWD